MNGAIARSTFKPCMSIWVHCTLQLPTHTRQPTNQNHRSHPGRAHFRWVLSYKVTLAHSMNWHHHLLGHRKKLKGQITTKLSLLCTHVAYWNAWDKRKWNKASGRDYEKTACIIKAVKINKITIWDWGPPMINPFFYSFTITIRNSSFISLLTHTHHL